MYSKTLTFDLNVTAPDIQNTTTPTDTETPPPITDNSTTGEPTDNQESNKYPTPYFLKELNPLMTIEVNTFHTF